MLMVMSNDNFDDLMMMITFNDNFNDDDNV